MTTQSRPADPPEIQETLPAQDKTILQYTQWMPEGGTEAIRATILLVHGYGEHLGRYQWLARQLTAHGFCVGGCDHRGMGRSLGDRVYIRDFAQYVDDLDVAQARLRRDTPAAVPALVYAHSMGGLIGLLHAETRQNARFAGTVLSGPLLGLGFPVPAWQSGLGKTLARLAPRYHFPLRARPDLLTHDLEERRLVASDPLLPNFTTPGWFVASQRAMQRAAENIARVNWPTLWLIPGADQVCSPAASRIVYDRLAATANAERHTWREYPGLFHEMHNEAPADRARVFADTLAWLDARL